MAQSTVTASKLVELVEHALMFTGCLLFIAVIAIAVAYMLCSLEHRLSKSHHMRLVFSALHLTAFVLLLGDCGLLLVWCGYAVAKTASLT